ncbi:MAG: hypothetical protein RL291_2116 [Pseudomonadota bacterium]
MLQSVNRVSGDSDPAIRLEGGDIGLVLLHGLGGTPRELRFVAQRAHDDTRATVFCPVLPGHCAGYAELQAVTWPEWARAAQNAVDDLSKTCRRVFVGGLSMGAVLALHLALTRREAVHGLVLLAPTFRLSGFTIPVHAHLFNLIQHKWIANLFDFPDLPPHGIKNDEIRREMMAAMAGPDTTAAGNLVTPGGAFWEHLQLMKAVRGRLHEITQPALIVHPRRDDVAHVRTAFRLAQRLGGPVTLRILENSYHVITLDQQRDEVGQEMAAFMRRHDR